MTAARRVGFVGFPRVTILDLIGPHEVFANASELGGGGLYETVIVARECAPFTSDSGVTLTPQEKFGSAPAFDTLVTPGGPGLREPDIQRQVAAWLKERAPQTRRMVSVCTGFYGLAAAGLLDGRRAATHWNHATDAARSFPNVTVDADVLYLCDPPFYTSAGVTSGIDLALALIAEDHGSGLALAVARELVIYLKRPGGQAQFSEPLRFQTRAVDRFAELAAWLPDHLTENLTIAALADRVHASPRNFARLFKKTFGTTVGDFVEAMRLDTGRERLEEGRRAVEDVALSVGFRSVEVFRRAFERKFGISPSVYARHFQRGS